MAGILCLLAVVYGFTAGCNRSSEQVRAVKGERAPSFTLSDLNGGEISLADFKGKVVLIEFWATWCPPCREALPSTNELVRKHGDKGLVAIAIAVQDNPDQVMDFAREKGIDIHLAMDDGVVSKVYGVRGIPAMFFVGRDGLITNELEGYSPGVDREIEEKVKELLDQQASL